MGQKDTFTSRWGLLFAVLGLAVGTGNIWRFPRIIAQYGGAFLIPWVLFLFIWAIPLILIELGMGKAFRKGPGSSPRYNHGRCQRNPDARLPASKVQSRAVRSRALSRCSPMQPLPSWRARRSGAC